MLSGYMWMGYDLSHNGLIKKSCQTKLCPSSKSMNKWGKKFKMMVKLKDRDKI